MIRDLAAQRDAGYDVDHQIVLPASPMLSFASCEPIGRRREFLTVGGAAALGLCGLKAPAVQGSELVSAGFGRARRCLLLFLTGGPSQIDTWDPKPDSPAEIRGEFSPILTATPGVMVSELFPRLAERSTQYRIVRSLTHHDTVHTTAGYAMLTGDIHRLANKATAGSAPPGPDDRPHLGATCFHFRRDRQPTTPPFALPEIIKDAAINEVPGQNAGFLGRNYDPILVEANADRTRLLPPPIALQLDVPQLRLRSRVALRSLIDGRLGRSSGQTRAAEDQFQRGVSLLQSPQLRQAFNLDDEPQRTREAYGTHLFGQCTLLARRLLEAGSSFVSVYWHYEGPEDSPVWDTHWNNFQHLRTRLAEPADRALSSVLDDLHTRGLLDDTLVLCMGEFGRSPRINDKAGRDHWPHVFSAIVAGAGIPGGTLCGASDVQGAFPAESPISAQDFNTTILHRLGVPAEYELIDQLDRPHRAGVGLVRAELFG